MSSMVRLLNLPRISGMASASFNASAISLLAPIPSTASLLAILCGFLFGIFHAKRPVTTIAFSLPASFLRASCKISSMDSFFCTFNKTASIYNHCVGLFFRIAERISCLLNGCQQHFSIYLIFRTAEADHSHFYMT